MADTRAQFDPIKILATLERHRVNFVVIGGLARVIHGSDELTRGVDVVPSTREENLRRLDEALSDLGARARRGRSAGQVREYLTEAGELKVVPVPEGTRGYDDLRRRATREPLGSGVRPSVASIGDLTRMLGALGREQDQERLTLMRRVAELERGRGLEL